MDSPGERRRKKKKTVLDDIEANTVFSQVGRNIVAVHRTALTSNGNG